MRATNTILAVDDDPDLLAATVRLLKGAGCGVPQAAGARSALEQPSGLDARPRAGYNFILMECPMPKMDGCDAAPAFWQTAIPSSTAPSEPVLPA